MNLKPLIVCLAPIVMLHAGVGCSSDNPNGHDTILSDTASDDSAAGDANDVESPDSDVASDTFDADSHADVDADATGADVDLEVADAVDSDDAADATPWTTPVDTGMCGQTPYEWLDPATLGDVVMSEPVIIYTMTKDVIQGMLDDLDYNGNVTIKYGAKVFIFRYTTQDHGKVIEATALMGFPDVPAGEIPFSAPAVLWLHGTTGFSSGCANSLFSEDGGLTSLLMASQGYISVSPDYLGMVGLGTQPAIHHPYLVAESTAIASWDAFRGGLKLLKQQTSDVLFDNRVLLWGGSQGGHATFIVDRYAPYYAPEFNIVGGLALIPATDLVGLTTDAVGHFSRATPSLAAFFTAAARWYRLRDRLDEILTEEIATKLPDLMDDSCDFSDENIGIDSVEDVITSGFKDAVLAGDWAGYETWLCLARENSVATTSVARRNDTPLLMVVSQIDSLINPAIERPSYDRLCETCGYHIEYLECQGADHSEGAAWSVDYQFEWAAARFAGEPLTDTCVRTDAECCANSPAEICVPPAFPGR